MFPPLSPFNPYHVIKVVHFCYKRCQNYFYACTQVSYVKIFYAYSCSFLGTQILLNKIEMPNISEGTIRDGHLKEVINIHFTIGYPLLYCKKNTNSV